MPGELIDILNNVQPFHSTVSGVPVKRVEYGRFHIMIEWYSPEELERLRADWGGM